MAYNDFASKCIRARARHIIRLAHEQATEWITEAREYRKDGYAPRYCVHGVSMWVDYDCACGDCEDGTYSVDVLLNMPFTMALEQARGEWDSYKREAAKVRNIKRDMIDALVEKGATQSDATEAVRHGFSYMDEKVDDMRDAFYKLV